MLRNKISLLFMVLILEGCFISNPVIENGTVELDVALEEQARTIIYNLSEEDVTSIRIDFTEGPEVEESLTFDAGEDIIFSLISGSWVIDIFGLNETGSEIVYAEASFTVTASQISQITVELQPMMNDTEEIDASGSAAVFLNWRGVDSAFLEEVSNVTALYGLVGETLVDISSELETDLVAGTASYTADPSPSGNYIIEFCLFNNECIMIATASESVNIRDNLQTSGTITLQDDDFNLNGVGIDISVDLPDIEEITFSFTNDISFTSSDISTGVTVSVTNSTVFNGYWWSLYSYTLPSGTDSVSLPTDLATGVHHLTVYVDKDGDLLSGTLRFSVED